MIILVLNCGSSSLKFCVYEIEGARDDLIASGSIDRIGLADSSLCIATTGKEASRETRDILNHEEAISVLLTELLPHPEYGCVSRIELVQAIGHRVVHGGEHLTASTLITPKVRDAIQECSQFAPLHNPANLNGIWACQRVLESVPQAAVFDTAFHSTLAPEVYLYALPRKMYEKDGIRRYGFHGTSHGYVTGQAEEILREAGKGPEPYSMVTCHLGNGASVAAVKGGRCVDTSMGFTPLEGLVMGTRCGDLDPAVVLHLLGEFGPKPLERILNRESGLKGLTGYSDMRDVLDVAEGRMPGGTDGTVTSVEQENALIALRLYAHRVKKYIGAYVAVLGGLDAVVFTAGVGQYCSRVRALILDTLGYLGLEVDWEANERNDAVITTAASGAMALVIPTNEELVIAHETYRLAVKA